MSSAAIRLGAQSVFAPVAAYSFSAAQIEDCRRFLEARTANTECVPIVEEAQLAMGADGKIAENGYRFNSVGFQLLATALASGLPALFSDLSAENPRKLEARANSSIAAAVYIYNTTLRVRFDTIRERALLVNHQERTIDGFLGIDHRMLDNTLFLNVVLDGMREKQPDAAFYRAELIGRELRLFFLDPASRRVDIYSDPLHSFAAGWCFENQEDSGRSIKAAPCIFTKFGVAVAAAKQEDKLSHIGSNLAGRTGLLVARAAKNTIQMQDVARSVRALAKTSLGFSDDKAVNEAATEQWVAYLSKRGLFRRAASHLIKQALIVGSDLTPRDMYSCNDATLFASRTAYDLLCSVLKDAKTQYKVERDMLQSVAMKMLTPAVKNLPRK